jgi:hypothetical protein
LPWDPLLKKLLNAFLPSVGFFASAPGIFIDGIFGDATSFFGSDELRHL